MERLKALSLRSGLRQGYPFLLLLFSIILEVLAIAIQQEKEIRHTNWKGRSKISLFTDDMTFHVESPKESKKPLRTNKFSRIAGYKSSQKLIAFLYIINGQSEKEIKKTVHLL